MPYATYNFSMKSEENLGASTPNILQMSLASDDDALAFKDNLDALIDGKVVTVTKILSENYSEPYPAGTNRSLRVALWTDDGATEQMRVPFLASGATVETALDALVTAGIELPSFGVPATRANGYVL